MSARSAARDWDASTYERVSDPQVGWARAILDRLPLEGNETVLDAGCGTGRVTQLLLDRLPRGQLVHAAAVIDAMATALAGCGCRS